MAQSEHDWARLGERLRLKFRELQKINMPADAFWTALAKHMLEETAKPRHAPRRRKANEAVDAG